MLKKMILIAGPCVIESNDRTYMIAEELKAIAERTGVDLYFKASFDKANRTSIDSYRGPGIDKGLEILKKIKSDLKIKVITDIHEPWQANVVAKVVDMIQIPAFLCRQTDLIVAAGNTHKPVMIKKGQFISPTEMGSIVKKVESTGNREILLCERGSSFGYNRLVVDMTGIYEMKKTGYPVVIDATHSNQRPGLNGESSGGNPEYAETIAKAAVAAGADAVFFEVHPCPEEALSDGANMVRLDEIEGIIGRVLKVFYAIE